MILLVHPLSFWEGGTIPAASAAPGTGTTVVGAARMPVPPPVGKAGAGGQAQTP